ncbi:MAG: membrane protein of unknown function [Promethearchaeota archaeon]|nr:MAG: membrane protein of unknown function [Candidatus Lokiarchaeota archaeon]
MVNHKGLNRVKLILVISSISFSFLFILLLMVLKDIPVLSSLIKQYIESGESFFIPSIPSQNLIVCISERFPKANFTLGHLIDLIIIANIILYTEASIYHYIKRVYWNGGIFGLRESTPLDYYGIYSIDAHSERTFSNEKVLPYSFKEVFYSNKSRKGTVLSCCTPQTITYLNKRCKTHSILLTDLFCNCGMYHSFFFKYLNYVRSLVFFSSFYLFLLFRLAFRYSSQKTKYSHFTFQIIYKKGIRLDSSTLPSISYITSLWNQIKVHKLNLKMKLKRIINHN